MRAGLRVAYPFNPSEIRAACPCLPSSLRGMARMAQRLSIQGVASPLFVPQVRHDVVDFCRRGRPSGGHAQAVTCGLHALGGHAAQGMPSQMTGCGATPPPVIAPSVGAGTAGIGIGIPLGIGPSTGMEIAPRLAPAATSRRWTLLQERIRHGAVWGDAPHGTAARRRRAAVLSYGLFGAGHNQPPDPPLPGPGSGSAWGSGSPEGSAPGSASGSAPPEISSHNA